MNKKTQSFDKILLMDTCCFEDAISNNNNCFNYSEILDFAKSNNIDLVITPYTLYECFQSLHSIDKLNAFMNKLLTFDDFWILNVNHITDFEGFEYGYDLLSYLKLFKQNTFLEYAEARKKLRIKVYDSLIPKINLFASLSACMYIAFTLKCMPSGLSHEQYYKLSVANSFFNVWKDRFQLLHSNFYNHEGVKVFDVSSGIIVKDIDAKDYLNKYMLDLIIQIISMANVQWSLYTDNKNPFGSELDVRISGEYIRLKKEINATSFSKVYQDYRKDVANGLDYDSCFDKLTENFCQRPLNREAYRFMLSKLFNNNRGGFGKKFNNSFIDFTNLSVLELIPDGSCVYMTSDKEWIDFLFRIHEQKQMKCVDDTIGFYKMFYRPSQQ